MFAADIERLFGVFTGVQMLREEQKSAKSLLGTG